MTGERNKYNICAHIDNLSNFRMVANQANNLFRIMHKELELVAKEMDVKTAFWPALVLMPENKKFFYLSI